MGTLKNKEIIIKSSNEFPCSYIEGRTEKRIFVNIPLNPKIREKVVSELTRKGFRRNYNHMYIPTCKSCSSCISLRININNFMLSKSNKRNLKVNDDLFLIDNKTFNTRRFELFKKYCELRHQRGQMKYMSELEFINFFHKNKNKTIIYDLVDKNKKLFGSILLDVLDDGCSAVYSFFDPILKKRGLGKNIILKTIQKLKETKNNFLYLGYWIKESKSMNYKSSFSNVEYYINGSWEKIYKF